VYIVGRLKNRVFHNYIKIDKNSDLNMVRMRSPVRLWLRAPHYKIHFEKSATILQQPEKNKRA
jgi:hypothetical protein